MRHIRQVESSNNMTCAHNGSDMAKNISSASSLYRPSTFLFTSPRLVKVISWRLVTHMFFQAFSDQYQHNFLSKATDYFLTSSMLQANENTPERKFASTGYRTHNQVMSQIRSQLSHLGALSMFSDT